MTDLIDCSNVKTSCFLYFGWLHQTQHGECERFEHGRNIFIVSVSVSMSESVSVSISMQGLPKKI